MTDIMTTTLQSVEKTSVFSEADFATHVGIDTFLFYHAIDSDLSKIEKIPNATTINNILNYSKNHKK